MRRSITALVAIVFLLCAFAPFSAGASEQTESASPELGLVVELLNGSTPLPDAQFSLYRVGDMNDAGVITLAADYAARFSVVGIHDQRGWADIANKMTTYVKDAGKAPSLSGRTAADGRVRFSESEGLTRGVYLVVGDDVYYQGMTYSSLPFLVTIPSWDPEEQTWLYETVARPKPGERHDDPTPIPDPTPVTPPDDGEPSIWKTAAGLLPKTDDALTFWSLVVAVSFLSLAALIQARKRR